MKKVLLIAAVAGLAMTSCKKEYTCECTVKTTANGQTTTATSSATSAKMKKSEAKDWCEKSNGTTTVGSVSSEVSCAIK
jgi:hypothetical protein